MSADQARTVPFFNYPALYQRHRAEYLELVDDVLSRGAYIMQRDLEEFERDLASYLGAKHVIGAADGTMALTMSLLCAGVGRGDEVILPAHTFVATAAAVRHAGGTPVLADCSDDHLVDPKSVAAKISPRTKCILPVQLNGRTCEMDALQKIADDNALPIVEDACQALGAKYRGKAAGTFGLAAALSFYPSKTLGCFGDGGAVVTNDDLVAERIRLLRDHGRNREGNVVLFGFNARLDNIQAAVLRFKLRTYDQEIGRRRELAQRYHDRLKDMPELLLPPSPAADGEHFDIYQNYEVEAEDRDGLRAHLRADGVSTILQWGGRTLQQYEALGLNRDTPRTEAMTARYLMLPMNTALVDADVDYICESIRAYYVARRQGPKGSRS